MWGRYLSPNLSSTSKSNSNPNLSLLELEFELVCELSQASSNKSELINQNYYTKFEGRAWVISWTHLKLTLFKSISKFLVPPLNHRHYNPYCYHAAYCFAIDTTKTWHVVLGSWFSEITCFRHRSDWLTKIWNN